MHTEGRGVPKDDGKAAVWFRKTAENPHAGPGNIGMLAELYEEGRGVPQDYVEAVKWYRRAAEIGDLQKNPKGAMQYWYKLGQFYEQGKGVSQDFHEALNCYRKAAENGLNPAQVRIGMFYEEGRHVTRDYSEAVKWYRKAAVSEFNPEWGYAEAQYRLALLYQRGQGVPQDDAEAVKWFQRAANQNYAEAQYNLGMAYEAGRGVKKDATEATKWYRKAAEQGLQIAFEKLGDAERRAVLAGREPTIPLDTLGAIPDDVRSLMEEINKKYEPVAKGGFLVPVGMNDKIRAKGKGVSKALQPLLADPSIDNRRLLRYVALMGVTEDPDAVDSLIAVYGRTPLFYMKAECLRAMGRIGGDKAGQFVLSTLEGDSDPGSRREKIDLLIDMQYEPALPAITEFGIHDPKGRGKQWLPIVFGIMGDKAVPFLMGKINDVDEDMRLIAINVLGQWLIPPEAARPLEQRYWVEPNPRIRSLILSGISNTISDLDEQKKLLEKIIEKERDGDVLKSANDILAAIDQDRAKAEDARKSKCASPEALQREIEVMKQSFLGIGGFGGHVDYDALLKASTVDDEPTLKIVRERIYRSRWHRDLDDVEKVNRVIRMNRLINTLK